MCSSWRQINVRKQDKLSEQTAVQVAGNNAAREAVGCKREAVVKETPAPTAKAAPTKAAPAPKAAAGTS